MTDGDKRLAFIVIGLVCVTILVIILFIALWAYKEVLAITLVLLFVACVGVYLWGQLNEQCLRHTRYKHKEEMPLGASPYPPQVQGAQAGPYSMPMAQPNQCYYPSAYYDQRLLLNPKSRIKLSTKRWPIRELG